MGEPDDLTLSIFFTIIFGAPFLEQPRTLEFLILLAILLGLPFFGGVFAGIATLIITRKTNFFIENK